MNGQKIGLGWVVFALGVAFPLFGAVLLKTGSIPVLWGLSGLLMEIVMIAMMAIVIGVVMGKMHGHLLWFTPSVSAAATTYFFIQAAIPPKGSFWDGFAASWLLGVLGPVLSILSLWFAYKLMWIGEAEAKNKLNARWNRFKAKHGLGNANKDGYITSEAGSNSRPLDAADLAKAFPVRTDEDGNIKGGFVIGVAACPSSQEEADILIGKPSERQQVCPVSGELIFSDQGDPTMYVTEGTATAPLLIMDPIKDDFHYLLVGQSGGGKTSAFVETTILAYPHSLVVGDPKTECLTATARYLRLAGRNVVWLNPKRRDTFSLDVLASLGTLDPDLTTRSEAIAAAIIEMKEGSEGAFYKQNVRKSFAGGIVCHLAEDFQAVVKWLEKGKELGFVEDPMSLANDRGFFDGALMHLRVKKIHTVGQSHPLKVEWLEKLSSKWKVTGLHVDAPGFHEWLRLVPKRPTLRTVVNWLKKPFSELLPEFNNVLATANAHIEAAEKANMEPHPIYQSIYGALGGWEKPDPNTLGNFAASISTDLSFMNNSAIARMLSGGSKKVVMADDLLDGNTTTFINIDTDTMLANPGSVKLVYTAIGYAITSQPGGKMPQGMTLGMIVDEMPQLRNFDILHSTFLQVYRGYGLRLMGVIQSAPGLDKMAGEGTFERWQDVCGAISVFGVGSSKQSKELEDIGGTYNAIVTNASVQGSQVVGTDGGPASSSTQEVEKPLFSKGRLTQMKKYEQFLFVKGKGASICGKAFYFLRPEFEEMVNPNPIPEILFPELEELYADVQVQEVASLLQFDMDGPKAKADIAEADISIKIVAITEDEARGFQKKALDLGAKWEAGNWYIPKGTKLASFRGLSWIKGLPGQDSAMGAAPQKVAAKKKCPECKSPMETVRDRDKNSPNYEKPVRKCKSCSYVEEVAKTAAEGRGQEKATTTRITDADAVKAAKTGQVSGVAPRQEDIGAVFAAVAKETEKSGYKPREIVPEVLSPMPDKAEEATDKAEGGSVASETGISDEAYEVPAEALVADAAAADRSKTAAMDFLGD